MTARRSAVERTPCPDPRCQKPLAMSGDLSRHDDERCKDGATCRPCREFCWIAYNPDAHHDLPERRKR